MSYLPPIPTAPMLQDQVPGSAGGSSPSASAGGTTGSVGSNPPTPTNGPSSPRSPAAEAAGTYGSLERLLNSAGDLPKPASDAAAQVLKDITNPLSQGHLLGDLRTALDAF